MLSRFATESTGLVIASKGVIDVGSAWMVAMIAVLLALLAFLAVAETAFTRITRIKAQTLAGERRTKSARALAALARTPERVLNALLLAGTIALMAEAFLGAILAQRLFGGWGILVAFFVNVVLSSSSPRRSPRPGRWCLPSALPWPPRCRSPRSSASHHWRSCHAP